MMWLLDSNACIEYMRGKNPLLLQRTAAADPATVFLCSVVLAELHYGAEQSRNPAGERAKIARLARQYVSLPFDDAAAIEYVRIRLALEAAGTPIGSFDMQIAATARVHGLTVVTHNTQHSSRVPGLKVVDWQIP